MKRPSSAPTLDPNSPHSAVYLAARREWNERYGSYIAEARNWRLVAFASLGVAAVAVGGFMWKAAQSTVQPFVVEVGKLGDALPVARADVALPVPVNVVRAQLARFISDLRTVSIDVPAQRAFITEAYAMLDKGGPALVFLNDYFSANDPFKRAANETIAVHVESVLPMPGGKTWRVSWREDNTSRDGRPQVSKAWEAQVTISINPPNTDAGVLANPIGLFVEAASWGERLQ